MESGSPALGSMLDTFDMHVDVCRATVGVVRRFGLETVRLEARVAAAAARLQTIVVAGQASRRRKVLKSTGVHAIAQTVVARWLIGTAAKRLGSCNNLSIWSNCQRVPVTPPEVPHHAGARRPPMSPSDDSSFVLPSFDDRDDLRRQPSHFKRDGVAVDVSDMLLWCSLESRNLLYDWIVGRGVKAQDPRDVGGCEEGVPPLAAGAHVPVGGVSPLRRHPTALGTSP